MGRLNETFKRSDPLTFDKVKDLKARLTEIVNASRSDVRLEWLPSRLGLNQEQFTNLFTILYLEKMDEHLAKIGASYEFVKKDDASSLAQAKRLLLELMDELKDPQNLKSPLYRNIQENSFYQSLRRGLSSLKEEITRRL